MNALGKLIKAGTISFNELLLKNYKQLSLNEVDVMIIIQLHYLEENSNFLSISKLKDSMSLSEEELSNHIFDLVSRGFLELEIDNDKKESFSLDGTIELLSKLLNDNGDNNTASMREVESRQVIAYVETSYGRVCSAADLSIINSWLDKKYSIDDIKKAVLESLQAKKYHLKYADAILSSRYQRRNDEPVAVDESIKKMLDSIYVKKR